MSRWVFMGPSSCLSGIIRMVSPHLQIIDDRCNSQPERHLFLVNLVKKSRFTKKTNSKVMQSQYQHLDIILGVIMKLIFLTVT